MNAKKLLTISRKNKQDENQEKIEKSQYRLFKKKNDKQIKKSICK